MGRNGALTRSQEPGVDGRVGAWGGGFRGVEAAPGRGASVPP